MLMAVDETWSRLCRVGYHLALPISGRSKHKMLPPIRRCRCTTKIAKSVESPHQSYPHLCMLQSPTTTVVKCSKATVRSPKLPAIGRAELSHRCSGDLISYPRHPRKTGPSLNLRHLRDQPLAGCRTSLRTVLAWFPTAWARPRTNLSVLRR